MKFIYPVQYTKLYMLHCARHLPTNIRGPQNPRGPQFIGFLGIRSILINRKNRDLS